MYHTIQIGHHDMLLSAFGFKRFGKVYKQAKLVARECLSQYRSVVRLSVQEAGIFTVAVCHPHTLSDDHFLVDVALGVFMRVNSSAAVSDFPLEASADQMDGYRRRR